MTPIRKYDLTINVQKDPDKKAVWKNIGEIAVWETEKGERLQTQLWMYPDLDIATFLQTPREQQNAPTESPLDTRNSEDEIDISDIPM